MLSNLIIICVMDSVFLVRMSVLMYQGSLNQAALAKHLQQDLAMCLLYLPALAPVGISF
jgi:hypothetical protein